MGVAGNSCLGNCCICHPVICQSTLSFTVIVVALIAHIEVQKSSPVEIVPTYFLGMFRFGFRASLERVTMTTQRVNIAEIPFFFFLREDSKNIQICRLIFLGLYLMGSLFVLRWWDAVVELE